jgi:hypothetical protein
MESKAKIGDVVRVIGGRPGHRYIVHHVSYNPVIDDYLLTLSRSGAVGPVIFMPMQGTKPAESLAVNVAPLCR